MNTGKLSIRRRAGACAATAIKAAVAGLLLAGTAAAQSWDVSLMFTGPTNFAAIQTGSPWRAGKLTGPSCTTGFAVLSAQHTTMSPVRGLRAGSPADLPAVGSTLTSFTSLGPDQITVPSNGVWLHPAQGPQGRNGDGDCAAVRFTAPLGPPKTFSYSGSFYGAYTQHNNAVVTAGIGNTVGGNGVVPKILKNGVLITTPTLSPTVTGIEQNFTNSVLLNAGDTLDFAVNNFGDYTSDSTILKLTVAAPLMMYPHSTTPVTPGPVNTCAPYRLCFDVNVPNGPVGNGSAVVSVQVVNNAVSPPVNVGQAVTGSTSADGQLCITMPSLPPGSNYDYIATTTFTQSMPNGMPPLTANEVDYSPLRGANNDLVCNVGTADCCPSYLSVNNLGSMFTNAAHSTPTPYAMSLNTSSPNYVTFTNAVRTQLMLAKAGACGASATAIRVTYTMWNTNSTSAPTSIPAGYSGWTQYTTAPQAPITVTVPVVGPVTGGGSFTVPVNPSYFVVVATASLVDDNGNKLNCTDVSSDCFKKQRFGDIHNPVSIQFRVAPGTATPATPAPTARIVF